RPKPPCCRAVAMDGHRILNSKRFGSGLKRGRIAIADEDDETRTRILEVTQRFDEETLPLAFADGANACNDKPAVPSRVTHLGSGALVPVRQRRQFLPDSVRHYMNPARIDAGVLQQRGRLCG